MSDILKQISAGEIECPDLCADDVCANSGKKVNANDCVDCLATAVQSFAGAILQGSERMRIAEAALRGVFDCKHCKDIIYWAPNEWKCDLDRRPIYPEHVCECWHERKKGNG